MQTYPCVDEESLAFLSSSWLGSRAFRERMRVPRSQQLQGRSLEVLKSQPGVFLVEVGSDWVDVTFDVRVWNRRLLMQRICPGPAKEP